MFKILDKRNGEVTAEQQAVFNKISTNNADGYVDGFLNSLRIAKMSSNVISIDSGLLSIQGFRSVNTDQATYTVNISPSEPIPFQLVATYSHYISDENDTLEITTRPVQDLRREPLFSGQNAVYEVELAEFNMTADGIADFTVTLEKIVYNEQDLSELLDKVTKAETNSATALEKVNELETQVIEKQGTAVYVGGTAQTRVDFDSDPQGQIDDIVDGTTPAGDSNKLGGVDAASYAKLTQVVRTDEAQSFNYAQKKTIAKNIYKPFNYGYNNGWIKCIEILAQYYSGGASEAVFAIHQGNSPWSYGLLRVYFYTGGGSISGINLKYVGIDSNSGGLTPSEIRGVYNDETKLLSIYIKGQSRFNSIGVQLISNLGTAIFNSLDLPFENSTEPTDYISCQWGEIYAGAITSNSAPVLAVDPTKLTPSTDPESGWTRGTTSSKLPSAGEYLVYAIYSPSGSTPTTYYTGTVVYDGTQGGGVLTDGVNLYSVTVNSSGFTFIKSTPSISEANVTSVYYKKK